MSCSDIEELMSRYLDGEMLETEQQRFLSHLDGCEDCRDMVEDCEQLLGVARSLADIPVPKDVSSRLRLRLQEELGLELSGAPHLYLVK